MCKVRASTQTSHIVRKNHKQNEYVKESSRVNFVTNFSSHFGSSLLAGSPVFLLHRDHVLSQPVYPFSSDFEIHFLK
ncbi:MAG: hypothetical protein AUI33_12950 [Ignavibacteria bacterium 13_1_40CM_2_61_4]|nr:MAG: hypothetical protein AUI33_12950 [Ignavibacteria bacterium 13_1_40CM_2_61_4]